MANTIKDVEKVKNAQRVLFEKVSRFVKVNGVVDDWTEGAISAFEFENGMPMTGKLTYKIYHMLVDDAEKEPKDEPKDEELLDEIDDETVEEDDDADWSEDDDA